MKMDHQKIEGMVLRKFYRWLNVFEKVKSKRMPVRKI